jgi:OOP family OmpA-OmpF porin
MAVNLVELVKGYLTPDIIQKAGSFVGESETATQKAMNGIVPTLIGAFANQASTTGGAEKLIRMLDAGKYDGSALNNLGSLFSGGETTRKAVTEGKDILGSLLGNKTEGLMEQIARFAGIRTGSASSLLALAVPLIMNLPRPPARHHRAESLGFGGVARRAEEFSERPVAGRDRIFSGMDRL